MTRKCIVLILFVALTLVGESARAQLVFPSGGAGGGGGSGTVTSVSVVTANGISGSVANPTTTPAITLTLGAITPSSVAIGVGSAITSSGPGGSLTAIGFTAPGTGVVTALGNPAGGTGGFALQSSIPTSANPSATAGPAAVNGTATTFMTSDSAPAIQLGTSAQKGLLQGDGATLPISAGVISCRTGTASLLGCLSVDGTIITVSGGAITVAKASSSTFGVVEVDNTTITASGGVISAAAGAGPFCALAGCTMAGNIAMGGNQITGLGSLGGVNGSGANGAGTALPFISGLSTGTASPGLEQLMNGFASLSENATITATSASPGVITYTAHGLVPGASGQFSNSGGALPAGISAATTYYVCKDANFTANTFDISLTWSNGACGALVNTSSTGSGTNTFTTNTTVQNPASTVVAVGPSGLTGSQNIPALQINQTWNTSAVVDAALLVNVTNIASGAAAKLFDLQIGGVSEFNVDKSGNTIAAGNITASAGTVSALTFTSSSTTGAGFGQSVSRNGGIGISLQNTNASSAATAVINLGSSTSATETQIILNGSGFSGGNGANTLNINSTQAMFLQTAGTNAISINTSQAVTTAASLKAGSHILAASAAPTISACGTGTPSVSGSDSFGSIVAGTVATSCVINFGTTWGAAPSCNAASGTAIASLTVSATTTQLTIGGTALGGDTITWICGSTAMLDEPANDNDVLGERMAA
jgi:hypothetical protein